MMLPACIVIGCVNLVHNPTVKYYKIPIHNQNICRQWYINTLREDLEPSNNHYVCIEHFDEESFLQNTQQQINGIQLIQNNQILKDDAVPSLFEIEVFQKMIQHQELVSNGNRSLPSTLQTIDLNDLSATISSLPHQPQQSLLQSLINGKAATTSLTTQNESNNLLISEQNKQNRNINPKTINGQKLNTIQQGDLINLRCSIKSCINNNLNNNNTNELVLYPLPKIPDIAKKWMIACQLYDNDLKLCREHFVQSDFNEYNYLKPDAIPSIFINSRNKINDIDNNSALLAKRARIDPEQRAELIARIPKAVKRTTAQAPILNNNANKIQKALKHTNSIMNTTSNPKINNSTSKFLSAALNNSPTILNNTSPLKTTNTTASSILTQTMTTNNKLISNLNIATNSISNVNANNKAQKAVKHTSAASLLKEILPPPIMQSTKRTPRAVKHTSNVSGTNANNSISITAPSTAVTPTSNQKYKGITTPTTGINNNINIPSVLNNHNSSIIINTSKSDNNLLMQQLQTTITTQASISNLSTNEIVLNNNIHQNNNITHKTTYVYKKITQPPEIELYLECEDDDLNESPALATDDVKLTNTTSPTTTTPTPTTTTTSMPVASNNTSNTQIATNFVSIDKTKLNNFSPITKVQHNDANNNNNKEKFLKEKTNNNNISPLNVKPIGNLINTSNKLTARQQQLQLQKIPNEKRHMQVLLKYYSRTDDKLLDKNDLNTTITTNYPSKCNICDKYLNNNIDFITHICSHLEGDNYISPFEAVCTTCSVCELSFKNPYDLIIHLDTEHLNELNEYKCRICERQHKSLNELLAHLNTVHTINEMPYRCDVCTFRTSFYADAIYHIKTLHKDSLNYFCPYCLKSILLPYGDKVQHVIVNNFYSHLITHFNKHENKELIESKCRHCRKCILHVRYMKEHLNNDHNNSITSNTTKSPSHLLTDSMDVDEDNLLKNHSTNKSSSRISTKINEGSNPRKRKLQKAIKSTSAFPRNSSISGNNKRMQQFRLLKEQQKPFDQFDLFPLDDEEDETISLIKPIDFKIIINTKSNNDDNANTKCLECGEDDFHAHFNRSYTCHQCRYGTFCSKSFEYHLHSHLASKRNALWNKLHTDSYKYKCECLFETNDGNTMASHILNCDKKSCQAKLASEVFTTEETTEQTENKNTTVDEIEMKDETKINEEKQVEKINEIINTNPAIIA